MIASRIFAPTLDKADLGISLESGTAIASGAADIAIVGHNLIPVEMGFDLARAAQRRITENTWLVLLYDEIVVPVAAMELFNPLLTLVSVVVRAAHIELVPRAT